MKILGLDPSSTCTGLAVVEGPSARPTLLTAERLTGKGTGPLGYLYRVGQMADALMEAVAEFEPDRAVVEMPHGRRHRRMGKRNMASLAIYGAAAGWLYGLLVYRMLKPCCVRAVSVADVHTTKAERQRLVMGMFPTYRREMDKGGDVADAVYLAWSELEAVERQLMKAVR